jgi:uncharacterized protein
MMNRAMDRSLGMVMLLLALAAGGCANRAAPAANPTQPVNIAGRTFHLELALDPDTRYQGLSDRPQLPPDGGMLFVFPRAVESCFVMRRCLIPLDLVFLGPNGRIVSMHRMAVEPYDTSDSQLRRYCSGWPALAAMEFVGGTIDQLGLQLGQRIDLPLEELKQQAR